MRTWPRGILILGGGVGGVVAANALRSRLSRDHRIVVVDREPAFTLAASFLWVMTGDRRPEQMSRPLDRLERKGIEVVRGEVERIDPERREAVVGGKTLHGDQLVVTLGAEFALDAIAGLADAGHTFCTLDGATRLRDALEQFRTGRVVVLTAAPAYKCPAAPYEAAMLIEADFRRRGVREAVDLSVYSAEPGRWGWRVPRSRRPSAAWSSRRASPTTPSIESPASRGGASSSRTAPVPSSTSSCTCRRSARPRARGLGARRRERLGARGPPDDGDAVPGRVRARRRDA